MLTVFARLLSLSLSFSCFPHRLSAALISGRGRRHQRACVCVCVCVCVNSLCHLHDWICSNVTAEYSQSDLGYHSALLFRLGPSLQYCIHTSTTLKILKVHIGAGGREDEEEGGGGGGGGDWR